MCVLCAMQSGSIDTSGVATQPTGRVVVVWTPSYHPLVDFFFYFHPVLPLLNLFFNGGCLFCSGFFFLGFGKWK